MNWNDAVAALDAMSGTRVSIRIVLAREPEALVAVFHGHLGPHTHDKKPSSFWPLVDVQPADVERSGVYLSEADFESAEIRPGGILVVSRGDVLVNIRPLAG